MSSKPNPLISDLLIALQSKQAKEGFATTVPLADQRRSKRSHPLPHVYVLRHTPSGKESYHCSLPACTHFLSSPEQVIGRASLCLSCNREFIVGEEKKLTCDTCGSKA